MRKLSQVLSFNGKTVYVISPMVVGTHTIQFESNFFKPYAEQVDIKEGENTLKISFVEDTTKFGEFLKTLTFPLESDGTVAIKNFRYSKWKPC